MQFVRLFLFARVVLCFSVGDFREEAEGLRSMGQEKRYWCGFIA